MQHSLVVWSCSFTLTSFQLGKEERARVREHLCVCVSERERLKFLPQSCQIRHQVAKGSSCRKRRDEGWTTWIWSRGRRISSQRFAWESSHWAEICRSTGQQSRPPETAGLPGNVPGVGGRWMMRLRDGCCINESACSVGALTSLVVPTQPSQPCADPEYSTAGLQWHRHPRGGGGSYRNKGGWIFIGNQWGRPC